MKSNPTSPVAHRTVPQTANGIKHPIDLFFEKLQRPEHDRKPLSPSNDLWDPWDKKNLPGK
ncbi:MAG: hypothetical protein HQL75_06230 [Magnetococcales bacterium]|nr:hypothetical protein [Magnetococcales bacterium]